MSSVPDDKQLVPELDPTQNFELWKIQHAAALERWKTQQTEELEKWKSQETARLEEWKINAVYNLEHCKQKDLFNLEHHKIIVTLGQNACKAIFLLAAGGCVALLSYIAQATQGTPSSIFTALKLFSFSALVATFLSGFAYFEIYLLRSTRLLIDSIPHPFLKKLFSIVNETIAYFLDFVACSLWLLAFGIIIYAALIVCPTLTTAVFSPAH